MKWKGRNRTMARLLIVDDEKHIREGLKTALAPEGYDIYLAGDGFFIGKSNGPGPMVQ